MSTVLKREIPMLLITVIGIVMIVSFFFAFDVLTTLSDVIMEWVTIIAGFALLLGAANMVILNSKHVAKITEKKWVYSLATLIVFGITLYVGLIPPLNNNEAFQWIYTNLQAPIAATTYSMLLFFMAWAGFRAMRSRNLEAAVFLVAAFIIVMLNAPMWTAILPFFGDIGNWILKVPGNAGWRALYIGISIGVVALALRVFAWFERGILGD
jgi:hypothetical protein